ncbi:MAG: CPBP family intramembrane metalloprotease [SAR324 cluster bacterium]|nr:CPBP family intramembrane metalloprotease [SAR324 cluster bacterium]MCZ6647471.1 CPBP family intramembrane metalloprotease [SAR324 cluster bacterium]
MSDGPFPHRLLLIAAIFYTPMLAGLFFLRAPGLLRVDDWTRLAFGLTVACGGSAGVVALSRWSSRHTGWGMRLHEEFRTVLGTLTSREILLLSLLSAFGEEILFRGVLHPRLGLWPTALLFGFFHFPYRRWLLPWTGFALVLGVSMGLLTDWFGSLWPALLLHFMVNYFNLHDLARPHADNSTDRA